MPLVAIVLVGHGERSVTSDCIESLKRLDYRPVLCIYVDNDSPDSALEHIQGLFPQVIAISGGGNLGYCGGNNLGITRAIEAGAEFILILNPDTVVCNPGFVSKLVSYMQSHPEVGKVGPKVFLRRYGNIQNTILTWPTVCGSALSFIADVLGTKRTVRSEEVQIPTEVVSLNGCCLLVRAQAFKTVGLYDAGLWGYMDEVDWDWQAEQAGWKRHYVPIESIIHLQKETGYDFASRANFYMKRNTALWYAKTGKYISMITWMATTLVIAVGRAISAPFLRRPPARYVSFAFKLGGAYVDVIKRLCDGTLRAASGLPGSKN
jgi:GT2 family glycosyltransferase